MQQDDIAERLEGIVAELRQVDADHDWLAQYLAADGDAIKSDEAAFIADCSTDTVVLRARRAAGTDAPIAILLAGAVWLFSRRRLLASIEIRDGRPGRLAAESRARKSTEMRLLPRKSA